MDAIFFLKKKTSIEFHLCKSNTGQLMEIVAEAKDVLAQASRHRG